MELLVATMLALLLIGARADEGIAGDALEAAGALESASMTELEQLRSKISVLESSVLEKAQQLKSKEDSIARLEKTIQEKLAIMTSLESEIKSIQKKGAVDVAELVEKSSARASELESQVERLKQEIESQTRKKAAVEARADEAEKQAHDLNLKLESYQRTIDEQKYRIQKTEHALEVAEEELMRTQMEATSKSEKLTEVHGAWLPPWLAMHGDHCQELGVTFWNQHAKPALYNFLQKVSEKSVRAKQLIEPHFDTAKTKLIPAVKQQFAAVTTSAKPYVQSASKKVVEFFAASRSTVRPHVVKAQELADPYLQEVKKISRPYIDQVMTITNPHIEKVQKTLKPYRKRAMRTYRRFMKSAVRYHRQVQDTMQEKLEKYDLTKPLATKETAWLLASGLLAFPIFFLYRLLSSLFCKKARKQPRNGHVSHSHHCRPKRRHIDK